MATKASIIKNAVFAIGAVPTTGNTVFTTIDEVTEFIPSEPTFEEIDVTSFSSPESEREFILGRKDAGTIQFTFNLVHSDAADTLLQNVSSTGVLCRFRYSATGLTARTYEGYVQSYKPDFSISSQMTATGVFRVNTQITT